MRTSPANAAVVASRPDRKRGEQSLVLVMSSPPLVRLAVRLSSPALSVRAPRSSAAPARMRSSPRREWSSRLGSSVRPSASTVPSARKTHRAVFRVVDDQSRRRCSLDRRGRQKRDSNASSDRRRAVVGRRGRSSAPCGPAAATRCRRSGRRRQLERRTALQQREAVARLRDARCRRRPRCASNARCGNQAWVKSGCSSCRSKVEHGEAAILVHARQRAGAAPVGRPAIAGLDDLAGMVDPDLRVRVVAEPQVQHRLLVAPLVPAIGGGRAHREVARLVVVELGDAVLALREAPFPCASSLVSRRWPPARRAGQAMVAQAERQQRQRMEAPAV